MRYRVRVVRVQVAERAVRAADEEAASGKVQEELAQPYGFIGRWETTAVEIEVVGIESALGSTGGSVEGGPLLLSVQDAAKHLGASRSLMYELVNTGAIESLHLAARRLVS